MSSIVAALKLSWDIRSDFYGGLLAASDLMCMGDEVKRGIARIRAEVFASWQPIFDGIAAGFTRERAEEEE